MEKEYNRIGLIVKYKEEEYILTGITKTVNKTMAMTPAKKVKDDGREYFIFEGQGENGIKIKFIDQRVKKVRD